MIVCKVSRYCQQRGFFNIVLSTDNNSFTPEDLLLLKHQFYVFYLRIYDAIVAIFIPEDLLLLNYQILCL